MTATTVLASGPFGPLSGARLLLAAGVAAAALALAGLAFYGWDWQAFLDWKRAAGPTPFFVGLALLPLVGVPTTPLFVIAGATFGLTTALAGSALSIAVNMALSYWLARRVLRRPLTRLLQRGGYRLPRFTPGKALSFLILMRLAPGVPAFLKNYSTALFDVPFGIYLAVSWAITFGYAVGMVVLGDSLFSGDPGEGAAALLVLVAVVAVFAAVYRRQRRLLAFDREDQVSALREAYPLSPPAVTYQSIVMRVLVMSAALTVAWWVVAQNAGWWFAAEAVAASVLISLAFATAPLTRFSPSGLLLFACYFLVETLRGGLDVAWRALHPRLPIAPGWVEYRLNLPPGAPQALFLNSVSLLPGTLSAALDGDMARIHRLSPGDQIEAELARLEYWAMRVFVAPEGRP